MNFRCGSSAALIGDRSFECTTSCYAYLDLYLDLYIDLYTDLCLDLYLDLCPDLYLDLCPDLYLDLCSATGPDRSDAPSHMAPKIEVVATLRFKMGASSSTMIKVDARSSAKSAII